MIGYSTTGQIHDLAVPKYHVVSYRKVLDNDEVKTVNSPVVDNDTTVVDAIAVAAFVPDISISDNQ